jgi:hypothetical protein
MREKTSRIISGHPRLMIAERRTPPGSADGSQASCVYPMEVDRRQAVRPHSSPTDLDRRLAIDADFSR